MIRVIDTYDKLNALFENGAFQRDRWENYINEIYSDSVKMFLEDVEEYTKDGEYTFEKDFLPILNEVYQNPKLELLHTSFLRVTKKLNERVKACFGRELQVDVVLYLGLCNGAGWVTEINGRITVLLGVEKILELSWYDIDSMRGLIYHELGHVYQMQYGVLEQESFDHRKNFVWQLFVEGIAMYFEQVLVGDKNYFHQDAEGWKQWCEEHYPQIKADFHNDLQTMNRRNQRYFGDWVSYHGKSDVGYYLGTRFVHSLLKKATLDELINYEIDAVWELYKAFIQNEE